MKSGQYRDFARTLVEKFFGYWGWEKYAPLLAHQGQLLTVDLLSGRITGRDPAERPAIPAIDELHSWLVQQLGRHHADPSEIDHATAEITIGIPYVIEGAKAFRTLDVVRGPDGHAYPIVEEVDAFFNGREVVPIGCRVSLAAKGRTFSFERRAAAEMR